jgi:tetratricopeptide (TPR) repeat protein
VRDPGFRRAQQLFQQGIELIVRYQLRAMSVLGQSPADAPDADVRNAFFSRARLRFERAHRLAPTDPEILFHLASMTAAIEERRSDGSVAREDELAIELFHHLRELDPDYQPDDVAGELGILHTRLEQYADAAAEYERSIGHALDESDASRAWLNLAEVTMLSGDVALAVRRYERSIELEREAGAGTGVLGLWGLAVALDRLGEHTRAVEEAGAALAAGGGTMEVLRSDAVFFVPAYEIYWYEALGNEAMAAAAASREDRVAALGQARAEIDRFLAEGGDRSRWADTARENSRRLAQEIARSQRNAVRRRGREAPEPHEWSHDRESNENDHWSP